MDRRSMKCNIGEEAKQKNSMQAQQNNNSKIKEQELKQERQKMKEQLKEEQDRMNRRFLLQTKHFLGNDSNYSFSHYYLSERASKNPHSMMLFNRLNKTAVKIENEQTQIGLGVMENTTNSQQNTSKEYENNEENINKNNDSENRTQELIRLSNLQNKEKNIKFSHSKENPQFFYQRDGLLQGFLKNQRMFSPQQSRRDNVFGLEDYFKQNTTYKSLHRMIRRSSCECLQCGGRCNKTQQLKGTIPSFVPRQITRLSLMKKWRKATKTLRQLCHFFKSTVKSQKQQQQRKMQNYRYTIVVNKQINTKQLALVSPVALKSPLRGSHSHKTNPINNTNPNSLSLSNYRASSPNSRRDSNLFGDFRRQSSLLVTSCENEKEKAGSPQEHADSNRKMNQQTRQESFSQKNISRKESSNAESIEDEFTQYNNKHTIINSNNNGLLRVKSTKEISLEQEMKQALTKVDGAFIQELAQEQQLEMKAEEKKHSLFRPPHNASSFSFRKHSGLKDDIVGGGTFRNLSTASKNPNNTSQHLISSSFLQTHWITHPSSFQIKQSASTQQKEQHMITINNPLTSQNYVNAIIPQILLQTPQKTHNNSISQSFQHTPQTNSLQIQKQSQKYQQEMGSSELQFHQSREYQQHHQNQTHKHPLNLQSPSNPYSERNRHPPRLNLQESNFFISKTAISNNTNSTLVTNSSFQQSPQIFPTHRKASCVSSRSIIQPRPSLSRLFPLSNSPSVMKLLSSPVLSSAKPLISNSFTQDQVVDCQNNEVKESIQQPKMYHQKQPKSQSHSDIATTATGVLDFLIPQKKLHNHDHNHKHKQHFHSLESKREKSSTELDSSHRQKNIIGNKIPDNGVLEHTKIKANQSHPYLLFHQDRQPHSMALDFRTNHSKDIRSKSLGKKINNKQIQQIKKSEVSMGTLRSIYNCHSQREEAHGGSQQQQLQLSSSCQHKESKNNKETTSTKLLKQIANIQFQEDEFKFRAEKPVVIQ